MFGKRGVDLEAEVDNSFDKLKKRVDALQQKLLTSEKLEAQVFDFMADFEKKVNTLVGKRLLEEESKLKSVLAEAKESVKRKDVFPRLKELEASVTSRVDAELSKLTARIESNTQQLAELKELLNRLKTTGASRAVKTTVATVNPGDLKEIERFEEEITSKLNKALDKIHRELGDTEQKLVEAHAAIEALEQTGVRGGVPPEVNDLKSFKLTMDKRLRELSNEIDTLSSEIASHEYVAILETEFRDKLKSLGKRLHSIEHINNPKTAAEVIKKLEEHALSISKLDNGFSELSRKAASKGQIDSLRQGLEVLSGRIDRLSKDMSKVAKVRLIENLQRETEGMKAGLRRLDKRILGVEKSSRDRIYELNQRLDGFYNELSKLAKKRGNASNKDIPRIRKELKAMWEEMDAFVGKAVKLEQLEFLKRGLKSINKKLENFSSRMDALEQGVKEVSPPEPQLSREFKEFKDYCVEQLEKTSKWINFINQNLK